MSGRHDYISRSLRDMWQLMIDMPGGYFEGVNLAEEAGTAKAGLGSDGLRAGTLGCEGSVEVSATEKHSFTTPNARRGAGRSIGRCIMQQEDMKLVVPHLKPYCRVAP